MSHSRYPPIENVKYLLNYVWKGGKKAEGLAALIRNDVSPIALFPPHKRKRRKTRQGVFFPCPLTRRSHHRGATNERMYVLHQGSE